MPALLTTAGPPAEIGRRERKKLETRAALVQAALELFTEHGVDATTVEDISDAVDVSARTFHRYFATKEDVLFADAAVRLEHFTAALAARPGGEALLDSLHAAAVDMVDSCLTDPVDERRRSALIRANPGLWARSLIQRDQWSRVVAEHVATRMRISADDPLPVLLGACTVGALRTAIDRWLDSPGTDPHAELDRCFELLGDLRAATAPRGARGGR